MPPKKLNNAAAINLLVLNMLEPQKRKRTQEDIAAELGVARTTLSDFTKRHRDEISEALAERSRDLDDIWIANKRARLQEWALMYENAYDNKDRATALREARAEMGEAGKLDVNFNVSGNVTHQHQIALSRTTELVAELNATGAIRALPEPGTDRPVLPAAVHAEADGPGS